MTTSSQFRKETAKLTALEGGLASLWEVIFLNSLNTWPCLLATANYLQGTINRLVVSGKSCWNQFFFIFLVEIGQIITQKVAACTTKGIPADNQIHIAKV